MEIENFSGTAYRGTKDYDQWEVNTANATGFGAAADDYMERGIDLNEQLVKNKPATFFMRVRGSSMIDAGISDGDIVIVDRSLTPKNGKIIIAVVDGEMLIRQYEKTFNKLRLVPATSKLSPLEVNEFQDFKVWGVVVYVIREC